MIRDYLKLDPIISNDSLPVPVNNDTDSIERELILKQLLFLRQDINELKELFLSNKGTVEPANKSLFVLPEKKENHISNIDDAFLKGIKDDAIGEITMTELEKEIIERTLKNCNGNRRKTAKILDISERTLYRKLKEYEIN